MSATAYILPLFVAVIGGWIGFRLARIGRYRPIGILFLLAGLGFWLCVHLADGQQGWDGIGYAIVAILIILPAAGGLLIGLLLGWWNRRRAHV